CQHQFFSSPSSLIVAHTELCPTQPASSPATAHLEFQAHSITCRGPPSRLKCAAGGKLIGVPTTSERLAGGRRLGREHRWRWPIAGVAVRLRPPRTLPGTPWPPRRRSTYHRTC